MHSARDQPRLQPSRIRKALFYPESSLAGFALGVDPTDPLAIGEHDFLNREINPFFMIRPSTMDDQIIMFLEMVFVSKLFLKTP